MVVVTYAGVDRAAGSEGNWYKAGAGHLRFDIHESSHNSWREE